MRRIPRTALLVLILSVLILPTPEPLCAQSGTAPSGHWEGSIKAPTGDLRIVVDLDLDAKGTWVGDIDVPDQGVTNLPLRDIKVSPEGITFAMTAGPGDPKFSGNLSSQGTELSGTFTQGGGSVPFSLKRTGDAKVVVPASSPALPDKFLGTWEGKLETPGGSLRIVIHLSNKDGAAVGSIDSPDQGASGIPVSSVATDADNIRLGVQIVSAEYKGKLNADGKTLDGEWSQSGAALPLALAKK